MPPAARPTRTRDQAAADRHVADVIEDFVARRLDTDAEVEFEAHLLVCDGCFSAYFVRTVDDL